MRYHLHTCLWRDNPAAKPVEEGEASDGKTHGEEREQLRYRPERRRREPNAAPPGASSALREGWFCRMINFSSSQAA